MKYFYLMLICDNNFNEYNIKKTKSFKISTFKSMIHKSYLGISSKQTNLGVFVLPRYFFPFTVE